MTKELVTTKAPLRTATRKRPPPRLSRSNSAAIVTGWLILLTGFILASIPGIGLTTQAFTVAVCTAAGVLGIVGAAAGKPFSGLFLALASVAAYFAFPLLPWLISLLGISAAAQ